MAEAAGTTRGRLEVFHQLQFYLHNRHDHELRYALAGLQSEWRLTSVPAGDHELALIVGIDETDEIAKHDAVSVAKSGTRQNYRSKRRIRQENRKPGRNQL